VWNLGEHTRTVARALVCADSAAMREIDQPTKGKLDDFARGLAGDIGDKTDTAGVMFKGWIVQGRVGALSDP
jgi:hypothetical protein